MSTTISEKVKAENWNIMQLMALGIPGDEAVKATDNGIDWHEVDRLIKSGCPSTLALEIAR